VSPDFRQGRIFKGWCGDDGKEYTSLDIIEKYVEISKGLNVVACYYDFSDKDLQTFAVSKGVSITPAEKSHESGERVLNVLFKNEMLAIYDIPELEGLVTELTTLLHKTPKTKAKDDRVDSTRYACVLIPWDFDSAIGSAQIEIEKPKTDYELRCQNYDDRYRKEEELNAEFEEWNALY
jgi:hypothetical protein